MALLHPYEQFTSQAGPTVLIREDLLEHYGVPEINHDGLEKLFTDELMLPAQDMTLKFYNGTALGHADKPFDFWRNGFRTPYSNTLRIPAACTGPHQTPMAGVIAVGLVAGAQKNRALPLRLLATETTLGSSAILATGLEVNSPVLAAIGTLGIGVVGIAKASSSDPTKYSELGKIRDLRETHDKDIVFPKQSYVHYLDKAT
ncbi:MAG: hypothetical protein JWO35_213 [Candidatus Saccharibacteria bacterium]|nr:hypothetical protein [Candidatus Saccharibacteria bacterium]